MGVLVHVLLYIPTLFSDVAALSPPLVTLGQKNSDQENAVVVEE